MDLYSHRMDYEYQKKIQINIYMKSRISFQDIFISIIYSELFFDKIKKKLSMIYSYNISVF